MAQGITATPEDAKARELFVEGEKAFNEGDFQTALDRFQTSYELSKRPKLLYNIGHAADRMRKDELAIESFEAYLSKGEPDEARRKKVEIRIKAMRTAQRADADAKAEKAAEASAIPEAQASPSNAGVPLLIAGGLVTAGGAAFLGLGLSNTSNYNELPQGTQWEEAEPSYNKGRRMTPAGIALVGAGVVTAIIGLVLLLKKNKSNTVSVSANRLQVNF